MFGHGAGADRAQTLANLAQYWQQSDGEHNADAKVAPVTGSAREELVTTELAVELIAIKEQLAKIVEMIVPPSEKPAVVPVEKAAPKPAEEKPSVAKSPGKKLAMKPAQAMPAATRPKPAKKDGVAEHVLRALAVPTSAPPATAQAAKSMSVHKTIPPKKMQQRYLKCSNYFDVLRTLSEEDEATEIFAEMPAEKPAEKFSEPTTARTRRSREDSIPNAGGEGAAAVNGELAGMRGRQPQPDTEKQYDATAVPDAPIRDWQSPCIPARRHEGVVVWEPGVRVVAQTVIDYTSTDVIFPGDEGVVLGPHPSKRGKVKVAWDRFEAGCGSTVYFDEIRPLSNDELITDAAPAMPHAASLVTLASIDHVTPPATHAEPPAIQESISTRPTRLSACY